MAGRPGGSTGPAIGNDGQHEARRSAAAVPHLERARFRCRPDVRPVGGRDRQRGSDGRPGTASRSRRWSIASSAGSPGASGSGSVSECRRVTLSIPLATRLEAPSGATSERLAATPMTAGGAASRGGSPAGRPRIARSASSGARRVDERPRLVRALVARQPERHATRPQPARLADGRVVAPGDRDPAVAESEGCGRGPQAPPCAPEVRTTLRHAGRRPRPFRPPSPRASRSARRRRSRLLHVDDDRRLGHDAVIDAAAPVVEPAQRPRGGGRSAGPGMATSG